jgi:hypothetical protein
MTPIPRNCEQLIAMRKAKSVPALPVLISLVGPLEFTNLTLLANAGTRYEWRAVSALDLEVFASVATPFRQLIEVLVDVAAAVPKRLILTFIEGPRIDCGEMRTNTDFALFDWFPMVVMPVRAAPERHIKAWNDGKALERKLWAELGKSIPIPYDNAVDLVVQIAKENQQCG